MALLSTVLAECSRTVAKLRNLRVHWLISTIALMSLGTCVWGQGAPTAEYQIKAVFLFNFAQFVEWPPASFQRPDAPLIIALLGDDPFGSYLDELVKGEKLGERSIVVRRFRRLEQVGDCHVLFIASSEEGDLPKIMTRVKTRSILTVGEAENFNRFGGIVRFVTENGKIRFRINLAAAKACNLTISSKLLRPATIVNAD